MIQRQMPIAAAVLARMSVAAQNFPAIGGSFQRRSLLAKVKRICSGTWMLVLGDRTAVDRWNWWRKISQSAQSDRRPLNLALNILH